MAPGDDVTDTTQVIFRHTVTRDDLIDMGYVVHDNVRFIESPKQAVEKQDPAQNYLVMRGRYG